MIKIYVCVECDRVIGCEENNQKKYCDSCPLRDKYCSSLILKENKFPCEEVQTTCIVCLSNFK
jgi:hypothetical protein